MSVVVVTSIGQMTLDADRWVLHTELPIRFFRGTEVVAEISQRDFKGCWLEGTVTTSFPGLEDEA